MQQDGEPDIHHTKERYENARAKFKRNDEVSEANRKLILDFLDDCELGKTVTGRAKKRIQPNRLIKYLYTLKQISRFLGDDISNVSQKRMEDFIRKVDANSLSYVIDGKELRLNYTAWTRRDIKVTLKKFYKWLHGSKNEYPSIVSWIDTHIEEGDPPALSIDEIRIMADYSKGPMRKAMVWLLFETGARIGEFLNVRLRNVTDKESYYLIRIEVSKTFKRTIPIYEAQNYLRDWLASHPDKTNPNAFLFPTTYPAFRAWLKRLGKQTLNKNVHPHLLRHSYATWLAGKKVGRYQMCKLMGWAMSSDMPDRYIDRLGVVEEETLNSIRGDELTKAEAVNSGLKKELADLQHKYGQIMEQLEQKSVADGFLEKLMGDKDVQDLLAQKVREIGLERQFMAL
jgi:integrase